MTTGPEVHLVDRMLASRGPTSEGDVSTDDRLASPWASSLQATCDCLSWRGVVDTVERRQREDELSHTAGPELTGELAQLIVVARILIERGHITDEELARKTSAVRNRMERE